MADPFADARKLEVSWSAFQAAESRIATLTAALDEAERALAYLMEDERGDAFIPRRADTLAQAEGDG